jgi:hypothetical protein
MARTHYLGPLPQFIPTLAAIALALWASLAVTPARAVPAHKHSLKKHYGQHLSAALHQCTTCHQRQDEAADPSAFDPDAPPHNPFGTRLRELGESLEAANQPQDVITRLQQIADEDADADGVSNQLEIFLGRQPGRAEGAPDPATLAEAQQKISRWQSERADYAWEPFRPVVRPPVPNVASASNPIDAFIATSLQRQGLALAPLAPQHVQLRRLYLDLIGLPPTRDELRAYLTDQAPDAYSRAVERLLASPQYGERWGRHWMDIWRYSDWAGWTDGKQIRDSQPHIWRWRDWIVESLNQDKGYDQMLLEMLAADELWPTDDDRLRATGFLARNYKMLSRETWLQDTVEHTAKALCGITVNCARCHDHMYDPISQQEYYTFRAIFEPHNVRLDRRPGQADTSLDGLPRVFDADASTKTYLFVRGDDRNPDTSRELPAGVPEFLGNASFQVAPIELPVAAYYPASRSFLQTELLAEAQQKQQQATVALSQAQEKVNTSQVALSALEAEVPDPAQLFADDHFTTRRDDLWEFGAGQWSFPGTHLIQNQSGADCTILSRSEHPTNFSALFQFRITGGDNWRSVGLNFDYASPDQYHGVYLSAHAGGPKLQLMHRQGTQSQYPENGRKPLAVALNRDYWLQVDVVGDLVNVSLDGQLELVYRLPTPRTNGRLSLWTFDAQADLLAARVIALPAETKLLTELPKTATPAPIATLPTARRALQQAQQQVDLLAKKLAVETAEAASVSARIAADRARYATPPAPEAPQLIAAASAAERSANLARAELELLTTQQALQSAEQNDPVSEAAQKALAEARQKQADATTKLDQAKQAASQPGDSYSPLGTVHPSTSTGRRAALAHWLVDPQHPLVARVAVNHIWQRHFSRGLVANAFDFGQNSAPPTHPALLDWLAAEFVQPTSGQPWSIKHLHRLIVTSHTYRQQSLAAPSAQQADPDNRYWSHAPTQRMQAEVVRDSVLHLAGDLDPTLGGPDIDHNQGLTVFRRSLYFRHAAEKQMPFLKLFDAAAVTECYERKASIIPQQALALANSELVIDCARRLTRRISQQSFAEERAFAAAAFEQVLARPATSAELDECVKFLAERATVYQSAPVPAGSPAIDPTLRARENLIHVLFNHNDFVTIR